MKYELNHLSNGARFLHIPASDATSVTALVLFGVGSRYETSKTSGLSHFLEHMFFKGTKKRPSAQMISETIDGVGGEMNAFTSKEYTGYYIKVAARHGALATEVLSDMLHNALFDQDEINRERGVIIQEIGMYEDQPMVYVGELFEERLFESTALGRAVIGTRANIKQFSRNDFIKHRDAYYTAENMVIALAGNTKLALPEIRPQFDHFRVGAVSKSKHEEPKGDQRFTMHVKKTEQTHLWFGFPGVSLHDENRFALRVLGAILGGGMSSRLFMSVRERRGLAYYVRCNSEFYTDTGYIAASAGVGSAKFEKASATILTEFKKIKDEVVKAPELEKAKEYIKGRLLLNLEGSDELAEFYGLQSVLQSELLLPEDIGHKIDAVTSDDVQRVAQRYLADENLKAAIISAKDYSPWLNQELKV